MVTAFSGGSLNQTTAVHCRLAVVVPLLAMLVLLAFFPSLFSELVDWDDDKNLKYNTFFRGFDDFRLAWMLTAHHEGHYQPLTWLSYACDHAIWGELPTGELVAFGYHLTNILLHAINTILVFLLGLRLLGFSLYSAPHLPENEAALKDRWSPQTDVVAKGLCSPGVFGLLLVVLLWSLHPLRVESVSWATERRQLLAAMLLLCATHARMSYVSRPSLLWYTTALVFHLLSLLSSAWGITFPVLLLLWNEEPFRRWRVMSCDQGDAGSRRTILWTSVIRVCESLPFFLLAVLFAAIAATAQQSASAWQSVSKLDVWQRLALVIHSSGWYVVTTVWPHPLVALRTIPKDWGLGNPAVSWAAAVTSAMLAVGLIRAVRGQRGWLIAVLCYLVILLPVSGIAQSGAQLVADRYSYLSTLPLFLALGIALARWPRLNPNASDERERVRSMGRIALPVGVLIVAFTWWTQTAWWSSLSLWEKAVIWSPANNPLAYNNYGVALARAGRVTEAVDVYTISHQLDPDDPKPLVNLGNVWFRKGDYERAIVEYDAALLRKNNHFEALVNRSIALRKLERYEDAVTGLSRAIEADPSHLTARAERAKTLALMGLRAEGLADYRRFLMLGGLRNREVEQLLFSQ